FIAFAGFCVLLLASSGVEALRLQSLKITLPLAPGGIVGDGVAKVLSVFGFTGATLILVALFATTLSLFTGVSWLPVMEKVGAGWCGGSRNGRAGRIARPERSRRNGAKQPWRRSASFS